MGIVYRIEQIYLSKELALKTLDKNCISEIAFRRFQQEARAAFSLDHPNLITMHDFGLLDNETPFLVMDLVNGETLAEHLKKNVRMTVDSALPIFTQVCFGLAHAHEQGIVHRDIKPEDFASRVRQISCKLPINTFHQETLTMSAYSVSSRSAQTMSMT